MLFCTRSCPGKAVILHRISKSRASTCGYQRINHAKVLLFFQIRKKTSKKIARKMDFTRESVQNNILCGTRARANEAGLNPV